MENFDMDVEKLIRGYFNHGKQQTDHIVHRQQVLIQARNKPKVTGHDVSSRSLTAGDKYGD